MKSCFIVCFAAIAVSCSTPKGLNFTGFENFQVQPLSFTNSRVSFGIGVFNPNSFDIRVNHLDAQIKLAGSNLGKYQLDSLVTLHGKKQLVLPVELVIKNGALLSNILSVIAGDSVAYTLIGKVKAGRKIGMAEIPFSYSGHLSQKDFYKNSDMIR